MNLSVLDESQCLLCLIIADSNSWQQNLRREREKIPKATELYLIEEKKHFLTNDCSCIWIEWTEGFSLYFIKYMKLQMIHLFPFEK